MTKRIVDIGPAMRKIRDIGKTLPRVDPALVAAALGAEPIARVPPESGNPLALYAVRAEIFRRLQSSGGRPALTETDRRVKIPLSDKEWTQLESIAAAVATKTCAPSTGQVASVLLNLALRSVLAEMNSETATPISKTQVSERLSGVPTGQ